MKRRLKVQLYLQWGGIILLLFVAMYLILRLNAQERQLRELSEAVPARAPEERQREDQLRTEQIDIARELVQTISMQYQAGGAPLTLVNEMKILQLALELEQLRTQNVPREQLEKLEQEQMKLLRDTFTMLETHYKAAGSSYEDMLNSRFRLLNYARNRY